LGELAAVYSAADIVFVGGSLIPIIGGHNILEPALFGKPIIVGPHTANVQPIVDEFRRGEALIQLERPTSRPYADQLIDVLWSLLEEPARRQALGQRARHVLERNRGATARTYAHIARFLRVAGNLESAAS
jgi:3-deoxy-D-manno-octulosonic-acid transferase